THCRVHATTACSLSRPLPRSASSDLASVTSIATLIISDVLLPARVNGRLLLVYSSEGVYVAFLSPLKSPHTYCRRTRDLSTSSKASATDAPGRRRSGCDSVHSLRPSPPCRTCFSAAPSRRANGAVRSRRGPWAPRREIDRHREILRRHDQRLRRSDRPDRSCP